MKPSFALDFRDGAIALLHRTSRGWQQVGRSPLDAPDLGEALTYMRSTALGLSPRGLSTKLVIPNDLILYTTVHAPGPDVAKRRRQIKAALEGLTPYKVEDLVYDWWGSGTEVQVAVVARETLAEAEAFAIEHRMNPVSFVGAPENGSYMGEPFFGPSALSATILSDGEKVERDQDPISVLAREPVKPTLPEAVVAEPVVAEPVVPDTVVAAEPVLTQTVVPEPVVAAPVMPEVAREKMDAPQASSAPPVEQPAPPPLAREEPVKAKAEARKPVTSTFDPAALAVDLVDEAPMAVDVAEEAPARPVLPAEPPVTARQAEPAKAAEPKVAAGPVVTDDLPPVPASAVIAAFASRRATGAPDDADKPRKAPALGPAPAQRSTVPSPTVPRPPLAKPAAALQTGTRETIAFPSKGALAAGKPLSGKPVKPISSAPAGLQAKPGRNIVQLPKQPAASGDVAEDAAAKTATKGQTGLDGRPVMPRGKPRYLGLILTGLLILALALVAAWSSYFLVSNETDPNATNAVASASPDAEPEVVPTPQDEALADGQIPPDDQAANGEAAANAPEAAPTAAAPEAVVEAAPKPEPAPATAITTEAAQAGGLGNDPQDEIFLAGADAPPQTSDPLILPQIVAGNDPPPDLAAPPPPFGTLYTFDAEGRIQPTPEGIVTPEGVLLVAGAPKLVPPARPAALAPTVATPVAATPPETTTLPESTAPVATGDPAAAIIADADIPMGAAFPSDPALADKRPRSRPAGLVDPASVSAKQGEAQDQDLAPTLAPAPGSRFASLRPQARPAALTIAPPETQAAEVVEPDNGAAAASLALNGVQPSAQGLAVSRKPAARPSGMDQAVDAAVAAAVRQPEPQQQQQAQPQQQAAAPEAEPEPEVEHAAPSLPTNASVARQATVKDAINLRRVALLGIFGTASGRYAMVRQPAGGVKKIKVGDNLDGGRVAAITATEVQYQKGGRMVTLSLPTG